MTARLMPGNATELERLACAALAEIERVPVPIRDLWNPDRCPIAMLPFLAWAYSVDRWSQSWPERAKRNAVKSAYYIHAHKGTIGALRRVVEPLGYLIEVVEWWQTEPIGEPGTFALKIGVNDTGITEPMYQELVWLIDDARPVSRHLTALQISLETSGAYYLVGSLSEGDVLDVYPPMQRDIVVTGAIGRGGREHTIDTLDIAHG